MNRLMEVLDREVEVARAELLDHPRDLVHPGSPARHAPTPAIHKPVRAVRLVCVPKPPELPFAHPQQLRCLTATQLPCLMQPNRIENPGHSDLRQHAIPPAETGQIVCYQTRTYRVLRTGARRPMGRTPVSLYSGMPRKGLERPCRRMPAMAMAPEGEPIPH